MGLEDFQRTGNDVLGYVAGVGVVLGILALIIVGGRMIHANFTGDPWIAARGMADLPYVVLGVVLLVASGSLTAALLQGSHHETADDLGTTLKEFEDSQNDAEREAADCDGALQDPESRDFVCPDDDKYDELVNTLPLEGDEDPRCTRDGAENCYAYCFIEGYATGNLVGAESPCLHAGFEESSWIWGPYSCPNLGEYWWNELDACPDAPKEEDIPEGLMGWDPSLYLFRTYNCEHFDEWVTTNIDEPDLYCDFSNPADR